MGISNTTKIIKKGVSVVAAGAIALGGVAAVPAFAVDPASADATNETLSVNDPTYIKDPTYIEFDDEVSDRLVPATKTPATSDQENVTEPKKDSIEDSGDDVEATPLGGKDGDAIVTSDDQISSTDSTGTSNDNGPRVTRGATDTNNGIVNTGQNSVENGTSAGATDAKTAISDEAANAIAGAAKAQADADAVGDGTNNYPPVSIDRAIKIPNSNTDYRLSINTNAQRGYVITYSNQTLGEDGVKQHNAAILNNDTYNKLSKGTIQETLTYTQELSNYNGDNSGVLVLRGFTSYTGKTAWLFVSYPDGTVNVSSPVTVTEDGTIDYGKLPLVQKSTYSIVIGEPPAQTTDPVDPTPTDPTEPDPTNPPKEDVTTPDDSTGKDEPTQKPNVDADQEDKTPVLDTGSDEKADAGDKQVTKNNTQDADKKASITGTLPQTGDENGALAAGLGLTAGASALLAAIGARRLRKDNE